MAKILRNTLSQEITAMSQLRQVYERTTPYYTANSDDQIPIPSLIYGIVHLPTGACLGFLETSQYRSAKYMVDRNEVKWLP